MFLILIVMQLQMQNLNFKFISHPTIAITKEKKFDYL